MGNGSVSGEKKNNEQKSDQSKTKTGQTHDVKKNGDLIFYACTDKARVITEILEERGWCRTKDPEVKNFLLKWSLEHQVDWKSFKEGKQLINNIPGQICFADKVNLWYTVRDYLNSRRNTAGFPVQTFLPMTFILDDDNEVLEFLRNFKKQNRMWIYKPRYSYAGQGIHVFSSGSELETILKVKSIIGNRIQYQTKSAGYLMQEYISRPLLIKGRKFDIRVHWLVAWTKPLLVFYNHHASVIRLSLNLYREFDFDRATHLTNLSVQENHYRYAFNQEATGMTMQNLNQYFNQCFRPFHPKMPQDWVLTVLQDRMQTIIRQVIRASKEKLERVAGHFGLFGCDFLLDENFRLWLLEVNDNPGVGWGNTQVNITTKPLFEETLDIVLECFEKHKRGRSILPINCLKNYQLIYDEKNDVEHLTHDDNQVFSDRSTARTLFRETSSRSLISKTLPQISTSRTTNNSSSSDIVSSKELNLPVVNEKNSKKLPESVEKPTILKTVDENIDNDQPKKSKSVQTKFSYARPTLSSEQSRKTSIKRSLSSNTTLGFSRTKRINLKPLAIEKKSDGISNSVVVNTNELEKKENTMNISET